MKLIKTLSSISKNVSKLLSAQKKEEQYLVIYKTEEHKIKSYIIDKPNLFDSFGNKAENRDNVGFKAYCYGRDSVRSFRHDRIVSITKL
jgi:predicted DNA-binding transcriptional regulator YafY